MPANTNPIFPVNGNNTADNATVWPVTLLTASGDYTGAGANNVLVHTAGLNGSEVRAMLFEAIGTNVQSVARIYINNGAANTTASNNNLLAQVLLPAVTASNTGPTGSPAWVPKGGLLQLKTGEKLYVGIGTTVASGWKVSTVARNY
jgi:hypothetical protein